MSLTVKILQYRGATGVGDVFVPYILTSEGNSVR